MNTLPRLPNVWPRFFTWNLLPALVDILGFGLLAGLVTILSCQSPSAWAGAGLTVPQRKDALCLALNASPGCTPLWESGRWGAGTITITVEDAVDEPDTPPVFSFYGEPPTYYPVRASTLSLTVEVVNSTTLPAPRILAQTYQLPPIDTYLLSLPPCLTPVRLAERQGSASYECLTEEQLAGQMDQVVKKLPWAYPDFQLAEGLRAIHGATGIPVAMFVASPVVHDETETDLATTFTAKIVWVFANGVR